MKFDVLGLGNALVDETFYVEKENTAIVTVLQVSASTPKISHFLV